jgi:hypothetical protein
MLQLATPYANDEDTEGSLDTWVRRIKERYPQKKVEWLRQAAGGAAPAEGEKSKSKKGKAGPEPAPVASSAPQPDVSMYNISDLKKKLVENGLPEALLGMFSDSDVVENARTMGLLDKKKDKK